MRDLSFAQAALVVVVGLACNRPRNAPEIEPSAVTSRNSNDAGREGLGTPVRPSDTPAVTIHRGEQPILFHVQVARTLEERASGLVGRPTLAADAGLLMIFDAPGVHPVSMTTTLLPIDMLFIGKDRRVVGIIENAKPKSATKYQVERPSQYVLEILGGMVAKLGLAAGQSVEFRAIPGL